MDTIHKKLENPQFANVKTIIFDFGGVLLDIDIPRTIAAFTQLGLNKLDANQIHPENAGIFLQYEKGEISSDKFIETLQNSSSCTQKPSKEQITTAWNELLLPFDFSRFELLQNLRKDYSLILLSNTNELHHIYFEQVFNSTNPFHKDFQTFFDKVYYSDEIKMRKPDREIYEKVQQTSQLTPAQTLFIDDNAPNLIEPSKMGWHTYHLKKSETIFDLFA